MIEDCKAGEIDIILVKSISRFARNTVDTLKYVRLLKDLGVEVRFDREKINTLSGDGEFLLTLLASYAQEESVSISKNIKWVLRKKFEQGIQNGFKNPYGYKWDGEVYRAEPEKSAIVKDIYNMYISGQSIYCIASSLAERGVTGQSGKPISSSTVRNILTSRCYTGVQVLQKYYISEEHKRKANTGELPMFLVEGVYEPMITEDDFDKAQEILSANDKSVKHSNPLRGKVKCGICGRGLARKNKWICNSQSHKGNKCDLIPVELGVFDERAGEIVVRNDYIMTDGKKQMRTYPRTAFSGKLYSESKEKLTRDTWRGKKVWCCKSVKIYEDKLRDMCFKLLGQYYEQEIAQFVDHILVKEKKLKFYYKDGEVRQWKER